MSTWSRNQTLRKAEYWSRTIAHHDAAHIITIRSARGYLLACGSIVTGGRVTNWTGVTEQQAHVCVGCVRTVTP